jgi:hypothetical protein
MDRFARADYLAEVSDLAVQHMAVEEKQRAERLVLRRSADFLLHRQMGQVGVDLGFGHLRRVAKVVEIDKPLDPMAIGLLGPSTVMAGAQGFAETV